ncbi:MAG: AAA family ATPase [Proteobacteria bacterium]|nr:AAA family ATPase [Pseudomonadota bacterium]
MVRFPVAIAFAACPPRALRVKLSPRASRRGEGRCPRWSRSVPNSFVAVATPGRSPSRPPRNATRPAEVLGQERAPEALRFGIGMARDGYDIFAFGPPGSRAGSRSTWSGWSRTCAPPSPRPSKAKNTAPARGPSRI